jgi:hypothetical protein
MGGCGCGSCRQAKSRPPATAVWTEADPAPRRFRVEAGCGRSYLLPFARGVATGAPGGAAVAWPPVFTAQHTRAPTSVHDPASPAITPSLSAVPRAPPPPSTPAVALAAARRAQPVARDPQVWRTIGKAGPGLRWRTRSGSGGAPCRGPLHSPPLPERQPRAPDKAPLLAGWNRGGRHDSQRLRASRRQGFRGPYGMVARAVRRRRRAPGFAPRPRCRARPLARGPEAPPRPRTPRRATGLVRRLSPRATAQAYDQLAPLPAPALPLRLGSPPFIPKTGQAPM